MKRDRPNILLFMSDNQPAELLGCYGNDEVHTPHLDELAGGGEYLLIENHCPVCAAAHACRGLCRGELELFREVLGPGVEVERVDHILTGARCCSYRVRRAKEDLGKERRP